MQYRETGWLSCRAVIRRTRGSRRRCPGRRRSTRSARSSAAMTGPRVECPRRPHHRSRAALRRRPGDHDRDPGVSDSAGRHEETRRQMRGTRNSADCAIRRASPSVGTSRVPVNRHRRLGRMRFCAMYPATEDEVRSEGGKGGRRRPKLLVQARSGRQTIAGDLMNPPTVALPRPWSAAVGPVAPASGTSTSIGTAEPPSGRTSPDERWPLRATGNRRDQSWRRGAHLVASTLVAASTTEVDLLVA